MCRFDRREPDLRVPGAVGLPHVRPEEITRVDIGDGGDVAVIGRREILAPQRRGQGARRVFHLGARFGGEARFGTGDQSGIGDRGGGNHIAPATMVVTKSSRFMIGIILVCDVKNTADVVRVGGAMARRPGQSVPRRGVCPSCYAAAPVSRPWPRRRLTT